MKRMPEKASQYIQEHFDNAFITNFEKVIDATGHQLYKVDLQSDDILYHLEFNEMGDLVNDKPEPTFEEDYFEGDFYADDSGEEII